jgi:hypothetical protein
MPAKLRLVNYRWPRLRTILANTGNLALPSILVPTYTLFTQFLGISKCLDIYGNNKKKPHLEDAGNYSDQIWIISSWGDGMWQLTNQYLGSGLHSDVYSDTKVPFMDSGDHTGQHWNFTAIGSAGSQLSHSDKCISISLVELTRNMTESFMWLLSSEVQ